MPSFKNRLGNIARKISDSLGDDDKKTTADTDTETTVIGGTTATTPLEVSFAAAMAKEARGEDSTQITVQDPVAPEAVEEQHGEGAIAFLNFDGGMGIADPSTLEGKVSIDVTGTWDVYGDQEVDEDNEVLFQVILTPMGKGNMEQEFTQVFQRGMQREYALVHVATLTLPSQHLLVGDEGTFGALNYERDVRDSPLSLIMTEAGLVFAPAVTEVGISELRNRDGAVHGVLITSEV